MKKPKKSKWFKWKIGGGLVFSLALLMQTAKADPAFEKAHEAAMQVADDADEMEETASTDQVIDKWESENTTTAANEVDGDNALPNERVTAATPFQSELPSSKTINTGLIKTGQAVASPHKSQTTAKTASGSTLTRTGSKQKTASDKTITIAKGAMNMTTPAQTKSTAPPQPQTQSPIEHTSTSAPERSPEPASAVPPSDDAPAAPESVVSSSSGASQPTSTDGTEASAVPDSNSPSDLQKPLKKKSHTKSHHS